MPDILPIFNKGMFPYLKIDENLTLKIKIELGYLVVPPRNVMLHSSVFDNVQNFYYPSPGGRQGNSFLYNEVFKKAKSDSLRQTTTGVMPKHIDIQGAPYSTFIDGSLQPGKVHPYYDLIQAPPDVSDYNPSLYAQFNQNTSQIQSNFQATLSENAQKVSDQTSKVGAVYVPATSKTNQSVQALGLPTLTTYNVWAIDGFKVNNFVNVGFLGFYPKSGANIADLQPYAQTWPYSNTAGIQVYASNSEVSLTRKYPLIQDIAHDPAAKFTIFNNAINIDNFSSSANVPYQAQNVGLGFGTQPVGFTLRFDAVYTNTVPVSTDNTSKGSLIEPKILISWGAVGSTTEEINRNYTSNKKIGLYTLDLTPGTPPKLYFNLSTQDLFETERDLNAYSVEIENLKPVELQQSASGVKFSNSYELYVYYTGSLLHIGNDPDPNTWSAVKGWSAQSAIALKLPTTTPTPSPSPSPTSTQQPDIKKETYAHYLDQNSKINIYARYMNFVFYYGPPLFSPFDKDNKTNNKIEDPKQYLKNTLNQVSTTLMATVPQGLTADDFAAQMQTSIKKNILQESAGNYDETSVNGKYGGASIYKDIRSAQNVLENIEVRVDSLGTNYSEYNYNVFGVKITMPYDLGGHTYVKFYPGIEINEPDILSSYAYYDLKLDDPALDISNILTSSLTYLTVKKFIEDSPSSTIKQNANFKFLNLNRSKVGNQILQFMRNNVSAIRVTAGYGENMNIFFEGIINNTRVVESLDKTEIEVEAEDLLAHLFERKETCIVSRTRINFLGMKFYDIIKQLVYYTEMNDHFRLRLGTDDGKSLYYNLKNNNNFRIPPTLSLASKVSLGNVFVAAYEADQNYLNVLKVIIPLMLQGPTQVQGTNSMVPFDIPILYWYSSVENNQNVDGIIMSSRTDAIRDRDKLFIKLASTMKDKSVKQITDLHGTVFGEDQVFTSSSESLNLQAIGLYRGLGIDNVPIYAQVINSNSLTPTPDINAQGYIGYNRTLLFDKPNANFTGGLVPTLLPNERAAFRFVQRYMSSIFNSIYEDIQLRVIVTKPLKEWGHFFLYLQDENKPLNSGPDDSYLYGSVTYNFNIQDNLIIADINGSKKPIQGAK